MQRKKAVIFDLDGTVLDTATDLAASLNHVLMEHGMPTHSVSQVQAFAGNGIHKLVARAVPHGTDPALMEDVFACMLEYYQAHCRENTKPYAGIEELLSVLRSRAIKLAVVSNKADAAVQELAENLLTGRFDFVMGATEGIPLKPQRDMIDRALSALEASADEALYVGDSQVDIETARNAQVDCVSVTWGFRSREALIEAGAENLADAPSQVLEFIR